MHFQVTGIRGTGTGATPAGGRGSRHWKRVSFASSPPRSEPPRSSPRSTRPRSPPARRGSSSGGGSARTGWRWRALIFLVLLVLVAIFAPLVVKIFGAPGPDVARPERPRPIFATATGPSERAHLRRRRARARRLQPHDLRRPGLADRRLLRDRAGDDRRRRSPACSPATSAAGSTRWSRARSTCCWRSPTCCWRPASPPRARSRSARAASGGCLGGLIKPGLGVVIFVIAFTSWTYMARIIRGQTLSLREKEFVEAARSVGASDTRIIFREILPNLIAPIIVYASILVPQVILYEAALSFLGVGVDRPAELGPDDLRRDPDLQRRLVVHAVPRAGAAVHRARLQPGRATRCRTRSTRGRRRLELSRQNDTSSSDRKGRKMRLKLAQAVRAGVRAARPRLGAVRRAATTTAAARAASEAPGSRRSSRRRPRRPTTPRRAAS